MDMPFVETLAEARHFLRGPSAYAHQTSPWKAPITSWMRASSVVDDRATDVNGQSASALAAE
jgi:hypothetical protein